MKDYLFYLLVLISFTQACSSDSDTTINKDNPVPNTEKVDTVIEEQVPPNPQPTDTKLILNKSTTTYELPTLIDTAFISGLNFDEKSNDSKLSFEQARHLSQRFVANTPTNYIRYVVASFCQIDSLKTIGEYEDYVENMDIGMMKHAVAHVEGEIIIDAERRVLLWSIDYHTYEADPYVSGSIVLGTVLHNLEVQNTMLLAESSAGGDPPSWGETRISTDISNSLIINTYSMERYGDYGIEEIDTIQKIYLMYFGEGGFVNVAN